MRVMKIKEIRKYKNIHRIMKDFLMIRYMCLAVIFIMIILAGLIGILSIKYHSDTDIAFLLLAGICILIGIILQIAIQDNRIDPESLQRADSELPDSLKFAGRKGLIGPVCYITEHFLVIAQGGFLRILLIKDIFSMEIKKTQGGYYFRRSFLEITTNEKTYQIGLAESMPDTEVKNMIAQIRRRKE